MERLGLSNEPRNWWQRHNDWMGERGLFTSSEGDLILMIGLAVYKKLRPAQAWSWHHREITCGRDLRACLRAGFCSWPGLYDVLFVTADGMWVCPHCVVKDVRRYTADIRGLYHDRIVALECTAEMDPDPNIKCCDCGKKLHT